MKILTQGTTEKFSVLYLVIVIASCCCHQGVLSNWNLSSNKLSLSNEKKKKMTDTTLTSCFKQTQTVMKQGNLITDGVCVLSRSVVSNSLRAHGLQPTRLLCPWDSPGKNNGVGCHSLLQTDRTVDPIKDCGDRAEGEVRTVVMLVFSLKILV